MVLSSKMCFLLIRNDNDHVRQWPVTKLNYRLKNPVKYLKRSILLFKHNEFGDTQGYGLRKRIILAFHKMPRVKFRDMFLLEPIKDVLFCC